MTDISHMETIRAARIAERDRLAYLGRDKLRYKADKAVRAATHDVLREHAKTRHRKEQDDE